MVLIRPFPVPAEGIRFRSGEIEALVNADSHGKGTLYITEAIISWINSVTGEGFTIPYKKMTLHAISRDPAVHPSNCLYIMVNGNLNDEDDIEEAEPDEDDEEEETTEVRFVPDDSSILDDIYKAVQDCTLLHPDESSDMSEDEEMEDDDFEGYDPAGGDGDGIRMPGGAVPEDDEDDSDEGRQIQNLQAFLMNRLRLGRGGLGPGGDAPQGNGASNGNHQNGNPPPFDPNQFADPDE